MKCIELVSNENNSLNIRYLCQFSAGNTYSDIYYTVYLFCFEMIFNCSKAWLALHSTQHDITICNVIKQNLTQNLF